MYIYRYACKCVHVHVCPYIYIYTHTHTYIHTYRRAFRFIVQPLRAKLHIFPGDLFDHLREATVQQREAYLHRFRAIFPRGEEQRIIAAGNHDIGLGQVYVCFVFV